jgi:hypothetical protein
VLVVFAGMKPVRLKANAVDKREALVTAKQELTPELLHQRKCDDKMILLWLSTLTQQLQHCTKH